MIKNLFNFILGSTIFFTSTAYLPGHGMDEVQGVAFRIGVVALLIVSFCLKPIRFITNKWVNSILGLCLISTMLLKGIAQTEALSSFTNILLGGTLFYIVVNYAEKKTIIDALCWSVCAHAIMVFFQSLNLDTTIINSSSGKTDITGLFEYKYALGVYMGVLAPFLMLWKRRTVGVVAIILTICSMSYAAIGIMVISLIYIYRNTRWFIPPVVILVILIIVGSLLNYPANDPKSIAYKIMSRADVQSRFLPIIMQKPIGYGLGSFKHIGPMVVNNTNSPYGNVTDGWSDFVERTAELGFIFLVLFGFLCKDIFMRGGIILSCIPLNMAFHSCFNHFNICVLFIVLFALVEIKTQKVV